MEEQLGQFQNLTNRQLKWSYWYVTHKIALRRWATMAIAAIAIAFWFFVGWQLVFYLVEFQIEENSVVNMMSSSNYSLVRIEEETPLTERFSDIVRLDGGSGGYDYYIRAENPNASWLLTFDYQFMASGEQTPVKKGFLLPGQQKLIMDFGIESQSVQARIFNKKWQRIKNYEQIKNNRFLPHITNPDFTAGALSGDPHRVTFNIENKSGYSYWDFGVQAALLSRGEIVAINYTSFQFRSGEVRYVQVPWNHVLPNIDSWQIEPDINFLDELNIMPPE